MTSNSGGGLIGEHKRWFLLGIATVVQISVSVIRLGFPALIPFIRSDLGLDRTQVGFISSILNAGAAVSGIPSGKIVDRLGERHILGYGAICSGLLILSVNAVSNFAMLLPILFVTGVLTTTSVPAGGKVVVRWFSKKQRGTAMGIRQMGIPLGGAVAAITLAPLALLTSWRISLSVAGVCAILIGMAALYLYREPADAQHNHRHEHHHPSVKSLFARSDICAVLIFAFMFGAGQWSFLTYLTLYLTEAINISIIMAAMLLAVGQLCGALGRVGWGLVSDRLFGGQRRPVLMIVGGLAMIMSLGMAMMSPDTPFFVIAVIVAILGFSVQGWNGLTHTLVSELAGVRVAGVAIGMVNSIGFLGVILVPPVFGALVDSTESYQAAWFMMAGLLLIGCCVLFFSRINEPPKGQTE